MKGQTWARAAGGERARALATSAIIMTRGKLNFPMVPRGKFMGIIHSSSRREGRIHKMRDFGCIVSPGKGQETESEDQRAT